MKFQPKFDNQFFSSSLQGGLRPEAGQSAPGALIPPAAEFASGLRVGPEFEVIQAGTMTVPTTIAESPQQVPEPGVWLAELLQQRKELKS